MHHNGRELRRPRDAHLDTGTPKWGRDQSHSSSIRKAPQRTRKRPRHGPHESHIKPDGAAAPATGADRGEQQHKSQRERQRARERHPVHPSKGQLS
eukprot:9893164-Alexandrium_andersonii.AAC.1